MNSEVLASLLRQSLVFAGGFIVAKGWFSAANWELVSGAAMTLATTAYMTWTRWNTTKVPS